MKLLRNILVLFFGIVTQSLYAAEEVSDFNVIDRALYELNQGHIHADNYKLLQEYKELKRKLNIIDNRSVIAILKELDLGSLPTQNKKTYTYSNGTVVAIFFAKFHNKDVYIKIGHTKGIWSLLSFHDQEAETIQTHKENQKEKREQILKREQVKTNKPKNDIKSTSTQKKEILIPQQSTITPQKLMVPKQVKNKKPKSQPNIEQVPQTIENKKRGASPTKEESPKALKKHKSSEVNTESTENEETIERKEAS